MVYSCSSFVGMTKQRQNLNLGSGCYHSGTIIHELTHAIGFYHEHSRSDRDDFVRIHYENVVSGHEFNFAKLSPQQNALLTPFDYESIMIYGDKAFSKNGQKTIETKGGQKIAYPFNKSQLTNLDVTAIKKLYQCP